MTALNGVTRAKRFSIHTAVRYRASETDPWHDGRTENVSCSGALIAGRHRMDEAAPVEMLLPLPEQIIGKAHLHVFCRGRVVRVSRPALPMLRPKFAVRWRELRVVNGEVRTLREPAANDDWQALIHDMYNELAVIVGSSDLLLEPNEERRKYRVATIKHASKRTVDLLDRLSAVLRKQVG